MFNWLKREPKRNPVVETTSPEVDPKPAAPRIKAPPKHPKTQRLIALERSKVAQRLKLAEIEAEREKEAEPIALEIERAERELAAVTEAVSASDKTLADLDQSEREHFEMVKRVRLEREAEDARLAAARARIEELRYGEMSAGAEKRVRQQQLDEQLGQLRERFDKARTTATGRSIERKIAEIVKQQETIVSRNPGARFYMFEIAIDNEAERLGINDRVRAATAVLKSAEFNAAFGAKLREARAAKARGADITEDEIRDIAVAVIEASAGPIDDVELFARYRKSAITVQTVGISESARDRCMESLSERARAHAQAAAHAQSTEAGAAA